MRLRLSVRRRLGVYSNVSELRILHRKRLEDRRPRLSAALREQSQHLAKHGAQVSTFATVFQSDFRWLEGTASLQGYTAENGTTRTFCRHCGSSLTFSSPGAPKDVVEVALGTMDVDVPVKPSAHLFVGSAANWTVPRDDLPRYEKARGSVEVKR